MTVSNQCGVSPLPLRMGRALLSLGSILLLTSLCFSIVLAHIGMSVAIVGLLLLRPQIWRLPGFFWGLGFAAWVMGGSIVLAIAEGREFFHSRHGTSFVWVSAYVMAIGLADIRTRTWAMSAAVCSVIASILIAAGQFFIGSGSVPPFRIDPSGPRFESSRGFLSRHLTQGFMMTLMFLIYLMRCDAALASMSKGWTWTGRILAAAGVLLANSRSGILAFAASIGAFLTAKHGLRFRILAVMVGVIVAVVGWVALITPEKIRRVVHMEDGRIIHWQVALVMIPRNPWIGVGANGAFSKENAQIVRELYPDGSQDMWLKVPHAHNIYLGLMTEHGIPALCLYVMMVIAILRHLHSRRAINPIGWPLGCGATAAMVVGGITEHYAGLSLPSYGFFAVLGLALALDRDYLEQRGMIRGCGSSGDHLS